VSGVPWRVLDLVLGETLHRVGLGEVLDVVLLETLHRSGLERDSG
jgi:hypothetical protein